MLFFNPVLYVCYLFFFAVVWYGMMCLFVSSPSCNNSFVSVRERELHWIVVLSNEGEDRADII